MPPTFAGGNFVRLCSFSPLRLRASELAAYSREVCFFVITGPLIVRKS